MSRVPITRRPFPAAAIVLFLLLGLSAPADALYAGGEAPLEDARVARALGDALYMGAYDERWRYAEQNLPVERGDIYLTGASGELTLEFRGGVLVELDHGTRLEVTDAARGPQLRLDHGAIYLVLLTSRTAYERVRVAWDGGSLYLGDRGSYRLDRFADGTVRAMVLRGRGRVRAGGGGRYLDPGEAILIRGSRFASRETSYRPGDYDSFDREVIDRYTGVFGYRPPRHFPHVILGLWELDTHGTWVYVPAWRTYGWKPRHPGRDWRPYRKGRWRRAPRGGWCWIPAESWGHTTSHYGAWAYLAGQGWIWKPGRTYSAARVRWVRSGDYLGWAPLGPSGKVVAPGGGKSPFLFLKAGDLRAERLAEPVTGRPISGDAPSADDPDSLMPSLSASGDTAAPPAPAPEDAAAATAAAEAEAAGLRLGDERGASVREAAEAEGVVLPPASGEEAPAEVAGKSEEEMTMPGAAATLPGESEPPATVGETRPEEAPAPAVAGGAAEAPEPSGGGPEVAAPGEDGSAMPAETYPAAPAEAEAEAPPPEAVDAGPPEAAKAERSAERERRRSENEAKKAGERAERESEKQLKARGGRAPETAGESPSGGANPAPAGAGGGAPPPGGTGGSAD